jgi:hypothetical protein
MVAGVKPYLASCCTAHLSPLLMGVPGQTLCWPFRTSNFEPDGILTTANFHSLEGASSWRGTWPSFFLTVDTVHFCVLLKQQERQVYVGTESALLHQ